MGTIRGLRSPTEAARRDALIDLWAYASLSLLTPDLLPVMLRLSRPGSKPATRRSEGGERKMSTTETAHETVYESGTTIYDSIREVSTI